MPILAPWVDVRSIGAGGGSVAQPLHGLLTVGPRSAGAEPGPACYSRGGSEPTVTDAAITLGLLGTGPLASDVALDAAAAATAIRDVADELGMDAAAAAEGILDVAAANMADAIREITIERGINPKDMSLLAIGGAGPMLGVLVAGELDIATVVVPEAAGNFSASGLLGADLTRSAARTRIMPLDSTTMDTASAVVGELLAELRSRPGTDTDRARTYPEASLDLRYVGQEHTLPVPVQLDGERILAGPDELAKAFEDSYRQTFGIVLDDPAELVTVRAAIRTNLPRPAGVVPGVQAVGAPTPAQRTDAYSFAARAWRVFDVYQRAALQPGHSMNGPLLVLENTSTIYVDEGHTAAVDPSGCLVVTRGGTAA